MIYVLIILLPLLVVVILFVLWKNMRDLNNHISKLEKNIDNLQYQNEMKDDMQVTMEFIPSTYYGIDKEFYYMTHIDDVLGDINMDC